MIELRHLQNFLAVIEAGGVRQASSVVNVSPSAISRSLQHLEADFGVPLFERRGKRLIATVQGETLRVEARSLLEGFESLRPRLAQLKKIESGSLRVGVNPTIANVLLPRVAIRFLRDHPKVEISTTVRDASGQVEMMREGKLDVIVGYERLFALQKELEITRLYETSVGWWVREGHPLCRKKKVTMGDFSDFPVISQHLPPLYMERFFDLCLSAERERKAGSVVHGHQVDDYSVLCRIAIASDAILLSPEQDIEAGGFVGRLVRLTAPAGMPDATISVAVPARPAPSPLANQFISILQEEIKTTFRQLQER